MQAVAVWSGMTIEPEKEKSGAGEGCSAPRDRATAAVRFGIGGALRFLSHAETLRLFHRACARASLAVRYTNGFNPHPKLSLPLPRAVGVGSADELLVVRLDDARGLPAPEEVAGRRHYAATVREGLRQVLPEAIEVREVELMRPGVSFQPVSAVYRFRLAFSADSGRGRRLKERIEERWRRPTLPIERSAPGKRRVRRIDLKAFLESAELTGDRLAICCNITMAGSIRVDEMMQLLELNTEDLAGPIQRTDVQWNLS